MMIIFKIFRKPWTREGPLILNFFKKPELSLKQRNQINNYLILNLFFYFKKLIPGLWKAAKDNLLFSNFREPALWEPVNF